MKNRNDVCILSCTKEEFSNIEKLIKKHNYKFILAWADNGENVDLCFCSSDKSIRSPEVLDYLTENYGTVKGNGVLSTAIISKSFFKVMMSDVEAHNISECLEKKMDNYYNDCNWIFADEFIKTEAENIRKLPLYKKKNIMWAYVKTTDIAVAGTKFKMKSLENETDMVFEASDDLYIMIGCRGEIYNISEEKFLKTYSVSDRKFDIFSQMPDYIPEVRICENEEYVSLDDKAHLCYPNTAKMIYAVPMSSRTKVYSEHNKGEYFVGNKGDYLAVREDDISDIYIIQREIFTQTYEPVK